jgi:predicted metalloprotease with PDZ domain
MRLVPALLCLAAYAAETRYEIDLAEAASRSLLVSVETTCLAAACEFQMPVWNATYQIRDFAQHVTGFEATRPYRLVAPSRWRLHAEPGERVRLRYRYYADGTSPFGVAASARHVFLNFAQVLVYPVERLRQPLTVAFRNVPAKWKIALELPERDGVFHARTYDELADAPAEISAFAETSFTVAGRRIRLVVDGDAGDYDLKLLESTTRKIAQTATDLMQDVPFPSYTFFYHFRPGGGGGMEHANGTAIDARSPCRDCSLAAITAHEFFHLWNVKRIRPRSLEPVDYTRENITPSLWFCEGVTSTYASYLQLQAGLLEPAAFLQGLAADITRYEQVPARLVQSAEEASIAAWLERYPSYRRPSRSVSYYLKGELAGYLLDLAIRHRSGGRRSLDDVMRRLNTEYAQAGKYFEDTEALERLASEAAGGDLRGAFDHLIRRATPVDWGTFLGYAGYRLRPETTEIATLGADSARAPGLGVSVSYVEPGGPADKAGLRAGDRVLSLQDRPVDRSLESTLLLLDPRPGVALHLEMERGGERRVLAVTPVFTRRVSYRVEDLPALSPSQQSLRSGWLRRPL